MYSKMIATTLIVGIFLLATVPGLANQLSPLWNIKVPTGHIDISAANPNGTKVAIVHKGTIQNDDFLYLKIYDVADSEKKPTAVDLITKGVSDVNKLLWISEDKLVVEHVFGEYGKWKTRWLIVNSDGKLEKKVNGKGRLLACEDESGNLQLTVFDSNKSSWDQSQTFVIRKMALPKFVQSKPKKFKVDKDDYWGKGKKRRKLIGWTKCGLRKIALKESEYDPTTDSHTAAMIEFADTFSGELLMEREYKEEKIGRIKAMLLSTMHNNHNGFYQFAPTFGGDADRWKIAHGDAEMASLSDELELLPIDLPMPQMQRLSRKVTLKDYKGTGDKSCKKAGTDGMVCIRKYSDFAGVSDRLPSAATNLRGNQIYRAKQAAGNFSNLYDVYYVNLKNSTGIFLGQILGQESTQLEFYPGSNHVLIGFGHSSNKWQPQAFQLYPLSKNE